MNDEFPLALPPGSILAGQYRIEKVLGQGGFGITYSAVDYKDGKRVAVKEFFPDMLAYREKTTVVSYPGERTENYQYGRAGFLEEAKTLAEFIGNESIVRIYTYFEENNTAYFAMEYVDGISFEKYLKEKGGKIPFSDAKRILVPIMEALAVVHSKGIVHRDVTPDNIYITNDNKVKLLDFGAARYSLGDKSRSLDVILKHGFAPKEQYMRRGRQGPFTDVYSLGATFYFALTGRRPPDAVERMDEDTLIPPTTLGAKLTQYQESAILRALELQPADRFQNMTEFRDVMLSDISEETQETQISQSAQEPQTTQPSQGPQTTQNMIVFGEPSQPQENTAPEKTVPEKTQQEGRSSEEEKQPPASVTEKKKPSGKLIGIIAGAAAVIVTGVVIAVAGNMSGSGEPQTSEKGSTTSAVTTTAPAETARTTEAPATTTTAEKAIPEEYRGDSRIVGNKISNIGVGGDFCPDGKNYFGHVISGTSDSPKDRLVYMNVGEGRENELFGNTCCTNLCYSDDKLYFLSKGYIYRSSGTSKTDFKFEKLTTGCKDGSIKRFYLSRGYLFIFSQDDSEEDGTLYRYNLVDECIEKRRKNDDKFLIDDEYIYFIADDGEGYSTVDAFRSTDFLSFFDYPFYWADSSIHFEYLSKDGIYLYVLTDDGAMLRKSNVEGTVWDLDADPALKGVKFNSMNVWNDIVFVTVSRGNKEYYLYKIKLEKDDKFSVEKLDSSSQDIPGPSILQHTTTVDVIYNICVKGTWQTKSITINSRGEKIS